MASIANPGAWPITLATGHVIPGRGSLQITNDVIRSPDNQASLKGMAMAGHVTLTMDPDPAPLPEAKVSIEAPALTGPLISKAVAEKTEPSYREAPSITGPLTKTEPAGEAVPGVVEAPAITNPSEPPKAKAEEETPPAREAPAINHATEPEPVPEPEAAPEPKTTPLKPVKGA